jgi:phosphopantothenoylcysteine decarboxylase/phosphopantothenate--cysteine ligase
VRRPHVLITAGGTSEPLDDVRVLTNRSTGRLGLALARAFVRLGADVTVIGAAGLQHHAEGLPVTVRFVPFTTAASLDAALTLELAARVDVLLMAAAVADYLPAPNPGKLSSDAPQLRIDLHRAPKILPTLRARAGAATKIVGFKLLSGVSESELIAVGDRQRAAASLDATVANDQQQLSEGAHPLFLLTADGQRRFEGARDEVAAALAAALIPAAPPVSLPPARGPLQGRVSGWWEVRGAVERSTRG